MTKQTKRASILITFFLIFTLISFLFLYYTFATPVEETLTYPLYAYEFNSVYTCIAKLKPNTVYDNLTTLRLGEESIYRRVVEYLTVNFTQILEGDSQANFTIKYRVNEYLEAAKWKKKIGEIPQQTLEATGTRINFTINSIPTIYPSSIQQIVSKFTEDTGILVSQYSLNITTSISIEVKTSVGIINKFLAPTMKIEFKSSSTEGEIIALSGLTSSLMGEITETEKIYNDWVEQQRSLVLASSAISVFGLLTSTWFFIKSRPKEPAKPEKLLEEFLSPYEEIIVEATQEQSEKEQIEPTTTIAVNSLGDLVKIADTLSKPIIHTQKQPETHIFSVIDDSTRYEFSTTLSALEKRKAIVEEYEEEE